MNVYNREQQYHTQKGEEIILDKYMFWLDFSLEAGHQPHTCAADKIHASDTQMAQSSSPLLFTRINYRHRDENVTICVK